MKNIFKKNAYFFILFIMFYILPILSSDKDFSISCLLLIYPLSVFILSICDTVANKFRWYFSLVVGIIFFPTIFIYYNESAYVYLMIYFLISIVGQISGLIIRYIHRKISDGRKK